MARAQRNGEGVEVGCAAVELRATDDMILAGGIGPSYARGQDGLLRAVATVIRSSDDARVAIVALDILAIRREYLDAATLGIQQRTGIPSDHIIINCTHTHHAPATIRFHGYDAVPDFAEQVKDAAIQAVVEADRRLSCARAYFIMGRETTIGQNSRIEMRDGTISWVNFKPEERLRPTGPFDADFPVFAFKRPNGSLSAVMFGHSTHSIGTRNRGRRSPSFYGLAAQRFEEETGACTTFIHGASGSTHLLELDGVEPSQLPIEAESRIVNALRYCVDQAEEAAIPRIGSLKRELAVQVRNFEEMAEERAVSDYCRKASCDKLFGLDTAAFFRKERAELAVHQGTSRKTWLSATRIGNIAIIGIPAELFAQLGIEIKRRSPFPHTLIAELANDHIGYVGNADAYRLGGYQIWMGHHSWTERGTGELIVDEAVRLLYELDTQL